MISKGSVRWAFNVAAWDPTDEDWILASQCIPFYDKERIDKFMFKRDAKACMAGCLMIRKFAHLASGKAYNEIEIARGKDGRPVMSNQTFPLDFNISHQGDYTVLAGEVKTNLMVGVDIMNLQQKSDQELPEFFRLMNRSFSNDEWKTIRTPESRDAQLALFFRLWCLKESYFKAIGIGLCTDLQRFSFRLKSPLHAENPCVDTIVEIDGVENSSWLFHEWLLDPEHCLSVALSSRTGSTKPQIDPMQFSLLTWSDLTQEAVPLLPPDINYCKRFMKKDERSPAH